LHSGGPGADPDDHACLNVALYGRGVRRWAMTERGRRQVVRTASRLAIGPSSVAWANDTLTIDIDELANPLPRRVLGQVRVHPQGLCRYSAALDSAGRHRWGPMAPCARVEVDLGAPSLRWQGRGYVDCNEGDEPIAVPFERWDWLRAALADGSTAVVYDVRPKQGGERLIATRFTPDGGTDTFAVAQPQTLPRSAWRVERTLRSDVGDGAAPRLVQTLEDTPFYARSLVQATLCGERVTAMHESLSIARLDSPLVRMMLRCRMLRAG
jgi:carotenoid 1,2-hydratase